MSSSSDSEFLLCFFLWCLLGASGTTSGGGSTTRWDGGELFFTFGENIINVLARELGDDLAQFLLVSINTNAGKDGLDGIGIWGFVATELSEKIGSDVTHFKLLVSTKRVRPVRQSKSDSKMG